jgi:hypothetical protein
LYKNNLIWNLTYHNYTSFAIAVQTPKSLFATQTILFDGDNFDKSRLEAVLRLNLKIIFYFCSAFCTKHYPKSIRFLFKIPDFLADLTCFFRRCISFSIRTSRILAGEL